MSTRSQFNERYTEDAKPKGVTRKGAGTAKPKSAAAASVVITSGEKTKAQKKAERKERERKEREKQERIAKYMPEDKRKLTSPKIKQYRTWWWVCLVAAIIFTIVAWFGREYIPEWASFVVLVLAYLFIAAALYLDLGKIRKERNRLQEERLSMNTKSGKAERRAMKAEIREAKKKAEAEMKAEAKAEAEGKTSGGLFSRSTKKATEAANSVVEKQQAAKTK